MFQVPGNSRLHEALRRRLCVLAFLLLCVAPTAAVLAWGVSRHLPWYVRAEAERLAGPLGLEVSLDRVFHPRPGVVVYEGLQLTDPETGRAILHCRQLRAAWSKPADANTTARQTLSLAASGAEIDAAGLDRLVELIQRGLRRGPGWADIEVCLNALEVSVRSAPSARMMTGVEGFLRPVHGGSYGEIWFRLAGTETAEPVRIRIGRDRGKKPPCTGLEFYTGGGAMPCSLLALGLPGLDRLGPQSRFRGRIWMNETPEGQTCDLTGQFAEIDLERLLGDRFPHTLGGTAQLTVEQARLQEGRLQQAAGSLTAGPGAVSRSLLDSAIQSLGLAQGVEPPGTGDLVAYEQLAVAFQLDGAGLRLRGVCPVPGPGTVMVGPSSRLLAEPDARWQPLPVASLVRTLVPPNRADVPAARQADWLWRVLPPPEAAAPESPQDIPATARSGLRERQF
jgi:hypothetical protein